MPPAKNVCLKAISLEQLLLLAIKRRLLVRKSRIDSDFDFSGLFQCRQEKISVDLFYNDNNDFMIMIMIMIIIFLQMPGNQL